MTPSSFLLVGLKPHTRTLAAEAVALVAPGARLVDVASLSEAQAQRAAPGEVEMLVLESETAPAETLAAARATDLKALPRWSIVVFGEAVARDGIEVVPPTLRDAAAVAEVFKYALRNYDLLRENARLRGDLHTVATRLSHDLRTPLGCISTTTDVLRELLSDSGSEDAALTQAITDSSSEMAILIERVSFVMRATARPRAAEAVMMDEVVLGALQLLELPLRDAGVVVRQPNEWPEVRGVASWLRVVWWNFLKNALQHSGPKPQIEAGWAEAGSSYRFWVEDRGPGVPEERRARLFLPFHLLHEPNAPRGFGLPIAERLMELQGGHCAYEAVETGGARFVFFLPR
jgi:signal transduction histidine kinase